MPVSYTHLEVSDELCTADVGRDQRKCQLRLLRFVRQVGGGSILFAYRLQGEGIVPECFLVFLFDLQTLLLPILTIVLVQAYAIADEVLVGTGGSYDDTVAVSYTHLIEGSSRQNRFPLCRQTVDVFFRQRTVSRQECRRA